MNYYRLDFKAATPDSMITDICLTVRALTMEDAIHLGIKAITVNNPQLNMTLIRGEKSP